MDVWQVFEYTSGILVQISTTKQININLVPLILRKPNWRFRLECRNLENDQKE